MEKSIRYSRPIISNVWENRLFKSGKTIQLWWDFCWSRISAGFGIVPIPAGAGAKIRYSPTRLFSVAQRHNHITPVLINLQSTGYQFAGG